MSLNGPQITSNGLKHPLVSNESLEEGHAEERGYAVGGVFEGEGHQVRAAAPGS